MINKIIESVSVALKNEFGEGYSIYREEKKQGLEEPCFFIACMNPSNRQFFGNRYFRKSQFCIHYFPQNGLQGNAECLAVAERLFCCLEYLEVDKDLARGTNMQYEVSDGILHFFVNYDMFVYRKSGPVPFMEEMELRKERRHYGSGKNP